MCRYKTKCWRIYRHTWSTVICIAFWHTSEFASIAQHIHTLSLERCWSILFIIRLIRCICHVIYEKHHTCTDRENVWKIVEGAHRKVTPLTTLPNASNESLAEFIVRDNEIRRQVLHVYIMHKYIRSGQNNVVVAQPFPNQ